MAEKDVDEQFAAIMAHWQDEALGHDPYGDELRDDPTGDAADHPADGGPDARDGSRGPRVNPVNPSPLPRPGSGLPVWPRPVPHPRDPAEAGTRPGPGEAPDAGRSEAADHAGPAGEVADDDDAHYSPPPPAPLPPSEDKHFWTMMVALVGGPLLFLYLLVFDRDGNGWWMMFALLVAVAGFVLLVLRQPLERDEDDDGIRL